jgi:hypothetical protein
MRKERKEVSWEEEDPMGKNAETREETLRSEEGLKEE